MDRIVVIGSSTGLREVLGIVAALRATGRDIEVVGALDDQAELHGATVHDVRVLGPLTMAQQFTEEKFVFAIGSIATQAERATIQASLGIPKDRFVNLLHPSVEIDATAEIGLGCIFHKGVSIGPGATVGSFVVLAVNTALGPDVHIDDFALVTSFVLVLSRAFVGSSTFIGSMSCILEDVRIGEFSRVGAGSVVNKDVPPNSLAVGNPARVLRSSK